MDEGTWTGDTGCTHETYVKLKGFAYITSRSAKKRPNYMHY